LASSKYGSQNIAFSVSAPGENTSRNPDIYMMQYILQHGQRYIAVVPEWQDFSE